MTTDKQHTLGQAADWTANLAIMGAIMNWLPSIAAGCAVFWYVLRGINFLRVNYMNKESWKGM